MRGRAWIAAGARAPCTANATAKCVESLQILRERLFKNRARLVAWAPDARVQFAGMADDCDCSGSHRRVSDEVSNIVTRVAFRRTRALATDRRIGRRTERRAAVDNGPSVHVIWNVVGNYRLAQG